MRADNQLKQELDLARGVHLALERHQLRREQGISTLGVLVGVVEEAGAVWRGWAEAAGWQVVVRMMGNLTEENASGMAVLYVCRNSEEMEDIPGMAMSVREWRGRQETVEQEQPGGGLAQTVGYLCRALDAADADQRRRPLALAVTPEAAARFLGGEPFDRVRTFFAEGIVTLPAGGGTDRSGEHPGIKASATNPGLAQSAPSLARQPLQPATVAGFEAARAALVRVEAAGSADAGEVDRARSAAERFLADLLDELPETRGLFELNTRLDFCFGPKRAEVDLLAAGLRLAVEIDGYYHFRDQEGYRRDRRKDALLQRQGYLVLRFLAEDVVVRLEEILEEIRVAVAFRRATQG